MAACSCGEHSLELQGMAACAYRGRSLEPQGTSSACKPEDAKGSLGVAYSALWPRPSPAVLDFVGDFVGKRTWSNIVGDAGRTHWGLCRKVHLRRESIARRRRGARLGGGAAGVYSVSYVC